MKWNHVAPWVVLATFAGLAGCEGAREPESFPQTAADGWLGAFNSGDLVGLGLRYSQDSQILPPNEPIVTGHEAIEEFWNTYSPGQVRIRVSEARSEMLGEYWFREGTYSAVEGDEGEPRLGKFIELWKNEDGAWLLYRHMWSPNAPAPAEMPVPAPPPAAAAPDAASDEPA